MQAAVLMILAATLAAVDSEGLMEARAFTAPDGLVLPYRLLRVEAMLGERLPMVVFLHGAGGRGNDNRSQLRDGLPTLLEGLLHRRCLLVAPQCPADQKWTGVDWQQRPHAPRTPEPTAAAAAVLALIEALARELPIDSARIRLTGVSMGGSGTWDLGSRAAHRFAGILPVCGGCDAAAAPLLSTLPIWAFQGARDTVVRPDLPRAMITALRKAGADLRYDEFPERGHDLGPLVYADVRVIEWLVGK